MIHVSFRAMGTQVEAWCSRPEGPAAVRTLFSEVEDTCSRFRPSSELMAVNSSPTYEHRLSPLLTEVVREADRARTLTGGLVDIGLGGAVSDWGYDRDFPEVTGRAAAPAIRRSPDWSIVGDRLTRHPDTQLDLGGICKGWTCDRAVEQGLCVVASAGGDLRSAHEETVVPVIDPWGDQAALLRVGVGALATSSVARRRWKVGDQEVSHLIDPRTMSPVESPVLSATVVAPTAVLAEAGAKAALLHGESALVWAAEQEWITSALVVWHDGSVYATPGVEVAA